jgi:hypothetical protein
VGDADQLAQVVDRLEEFAQVVEGHEAPGSTALA